MINWKKIIIVAVLFWLFLLASFGIGGELSVSLENDVLHDTDRAYTHGTRIFYLFDKAPNFATRFWKNKDVRFGVALAQYMYTPSDISISELIKDDRPYGGWLYLEALLLVRDNQFMDIIGIDIGTTGKESYSESVQRYIHSRIDSSIPQGWDNQIDSEPGLNLLYQKKYRWRHNNIFDVIPQVGGSLGNIYTYVNLGGMARLGWNIPDNFGHLRMEPSARNSLYSSYLLIGAEGRYVLRNIFLDGNTFEDSHSVDKRDFVYDLYCGLGISRGNFELLYCDTYRSKEFHGQDKDNAFSTVTLSWKY